MRCLQGEEEREKGLTGEMPRAHVAAVGDTCR